MSEKEYYRGRDGWFDKYYADLITPEFADWWFQFYGHPDIYYRNAQIDERDEYFVRMSFAFRGWQAHEDFVKPQERERVEMVTQVAPKTEVSRPSPIKPTGRGW